jgi:membrane protein implicated in regulation of membrane protease activity
MDVSSLFSLWWVWLAAALALGILEILVPGFIFVGFAFAAVLMAILHLAFGMAISLPAKFALFAGLALVGWYVMRRVFSGRHSSVKTFKDDINDG